MVSRPTEAVIVAAWWKRRCFKEFHWPRPVVADGDGDTDGAVGPSRWACSVFPGRRKSLVMPGCRERVAAVASATSPTKGNPTDDEPDRFARFGRHAGGIGVFDARKAAIFLTAPATTTNATGFGIRRLPRARWVSPE
jgi:hypothetical protein